MRLRRLVRALVLLVLALALVPGCGSGKPAAPAGPRDMELQEIWVMYHGDKGHQGRVPKGLNDFKQFQVIHSAGFRALQTGRCVVIYGVDLKHLDDPKHKVLAYEKDAPQKGGAVLMADGKVRTMSADEFRAAAKAKG